MIHSSEIYPPSAKKILLVGGYPPPYGGVSVHIYRLEKLLASEGKEVSVFNIGNQKKGDLLFYFKFIKTLLLNQFDLIHFHYPSKKIYQLTQFFSPKCKSMLTIHNSRIEIGSNSFLNKYHNSIFKIIAVAEHVKHKILDQYSTLQDRITVKNAFIVPPIHEKEAISSTYPESLNTFIKKQNTLIMANAWKIVFHQKEDLYGLDMCLQLMHNLYTQNKEIDTGLIFAISDDQHEQEYIQKMKEYAKEKGVSERIYFLTGNYQIWPLFERIHIFVRPTNTDGDALSIREALHFGKTVIASDICDRPKGTITFKNRDPQDFLKKVINSIK